MTPHIETDRLVLRHIEIVDADSLFALINNVKVYNALTLKISSAALLHKAWKCILRFAATMFSWAASLTVRNLVIGWANRSGAKVICLKPPTLS